MRISIRFFSTVAAALLAALILMAGLGTSASAHSVLTDTSPDDGEQVASAPDEVTLTFNEDITDLGTEIVVTTADEEEVSSGETTVDGPTVTQELGTERPDGTYTVTWRAVSADGHPISGTYTFTATDAVGTGESDDSDNSDDSDDSDDSDNSAAQTGEDSAGDTDDSEADDDSSEATTPAVDAGQDPQDSPVLIWAVALAGAAAVVAIVVVVLRKRRGLGD